MNEAGSIGTVKATAIESIGAWRGSGATGPTVATTGERSLMAQEVDSALVAALPP